MATGLRAIVLPDFICGVITFAFRFLLFLWLSPLLDTISSSFKILDAISLSIFKRLDAILLLLVFSSLLSDISLLSDVMVLKMVIFY